MENYHDTTILLATIAILFPIACYGLCIAITQPANKEAIEAIAPLFLQKEDILPPPPGPGADERKYPAIPKVKGFLKENVAANPDNTPINFEDLIHLDRAVFQDARASIESSLKIARDLKYGDCNTAGLILTDLKEYVQKKQTHA